MPPRTIAIQDFAGLNLLADPPEASGTLAQAIDMLNVDLDQPGRIRTRDGYQDFTTVAAADRYLSLASFSSTNGASWLFASRPTGVDAIGNNGLVGQTVATTPTEYAGHTFARFGTPAAQRMYFASYGDTLRYFEQNLTNVLAGSFATVPGAPSGYNVALYPVGNRLAMGHLTTGRSQVQFSAPGDPSTWLARDNLDLDPGDGEAIAGLVAWRDLLFAFKGTKYFVFTGTSTDAQGNAIFNYRAVRTGEGIATYLGATAAPDGVYFINTRGIWHTNGGPPVSISDNLAPFFIGTPIWGSGTLSATPNFAACYSQGKLFFAADTSAGRRVFMRLRGQWVVWDIPAAGFASHLNTLAFSYQTGANKVGRQVPAVTTDAGGAISSFYQDGWDDYGPYYRGRRLHASENKRIREVGIWGSGSPTFSMFTDRGSTDALAAAVTLGTAPAVLRALQRKSRVGREFSWKFSAASGAWNVSSLEIYIADSRVN